MGWGRMFLLGNVGQQMDLAEHENELSSLKTKLAMQRMLGESADVQIGKLIKETDELKLYLAALIRLLVSKNLVAPEEIARIVDTLDREDGIDRKFTGPII